METPVLEVCDLSVSAGERPVLRGVSLAVLPGEVHVLLGPNGGGKTTLLMAVMGMPGYRVTAGRVLFCGEDVTALGADERARRGIALSFQRPPAVRGVTARALLGEILARRGLAAAAAEELAASILSEPLLERDLNVGLSGGEVKRSELLQLLALDPALALFDEPESGVDLDGIAVVGAGMRRLLGRDGGGAARGRPRSSSRTPATSCARCRPTAGTCSCAGRSSAAAGRERSSRTCGRTGTRGA